MECEMCTMLVTTFAKETERHVKEVKFLEQEIKTLIGAIRSAPDLHSLRSVANDSVERMRQRSLEEERARLKELRSGSSKTVLLEKAPKKVNETDVG